MLGLEAGRERITSVHGVKIDPVPVLRPRHSGHGLALKVTP
jgi:hypothetical protein